MPLTDGHQRFPQENNVYKNVDERYSVNMAHALGAVAAIPREQTVIVNPCESGSSRFKWNHSLPLHIKHEICMLTTLFYTGLLGQPCQWGLKMKR